MPDFDRPPTESFPRYYAATPPGVRGYQLLALLFAGAAIWCLWTVSTPVYVTPDSVVSMGALFLLLVALAYWAFYRGMARHELRLDEDQSHYSVRWNRLTLGETGIYTDFGTVRTEPARDGAVRVWLDWKSPERRPLLLSASVTPQEAEQISAGISALHEPHWQLEPEMEDGKVIIRDSFRVSVKSSRRAKQKWSAPAGLLLIVLTSLPLAVGLHLQVVETALQDHGRTVQATVTGHDRHSSKGSWTYYLSYQFDAGGRLYYGRSTTSYRLYQRIRNGSTVDVLYLPEEPRVSQLLSSRAAPYVIFYLMGGVFWLLGLANVVCGLRTNTPFGR